jgi:hypothetical protein
MADERRTGGQRGNPLMMGRGQGPDSVNPHPDNR